jgi:hypothetical protein
VLAALGGFNPDPWSAMLALAPVRDPDTPIPERVRAIERAGATLRSFLTGFTRSEATSLLWRTFADSLRSLDIGGIYEMAVPMDGSPGGWRRFSFQGGQIDESAYLFEILEAERALASTTQPVPPRTQSAQLATASRRDNETSPFGRIRGAASLRPTSPDQNDLYQLRFGVEIDLGDMPWSAFQTLLVEAGELTDLAHRFGPDASLELEPAAAREIARRFEKLHGDSAFVAAELLRAGPETLTLLPRIVIPEGLLVRKRDETSGRVWTDVDLRLRLNMPYLRHAYPGIAEYLEGLEGLLELRTRIQDEQGNRLVTSTLDTRDFTVQMQLALHEGRLLPRNWKGEPQWGQTVEPFESSGRSVTVSELTLHMAGMQFAIKDIRWKAQYETRMGFAGFQAVFDRPPRVEVTGRLWHILPVWMINVLIPSNLEDLAGRFFHTFSESNHGRGAQLSVGYAPGALQNRLVVRVAGDLEDSGFISFGLRLFGSRFLPEPGLYREWRGLVGRTIDAFGRDFDLYVATTQPGS